MSHHSVISVPMIFYTLIAALYANGSLKKEQKNSCFYSVGYNDMIMDKAMDINSRIIVFYGYNVCFYGSLCDTHDWLALPLFRTKMALTIFINTDPAHKITG